MICGDVIDLVSHWSDHKFEFKYNCHVTIDNLTFKCLSKQKSVICTDVIDLVSHWSDHKFEFKYNCHMTCKVAAN